VCIPKPSCVKKRKRFQNIYIHIDSFLKRLDKIGDGDFPIERYFRIFLLDIFINHTEDSKKNPKVTHMKIRRRFQKLQVAGCIKRMPKHPLKQKHGAYTCYCIEDPNVLVLHPRLTLSTCSITCLNLSFVKMSDRMLNGSNSQRWFQNDFYHTH